MHRKYCDRCCTIINDKINLGKGDAAGAAVDFEESPLSKTQPSLSEGPVIISHDVAKKKEVDKEKSRGSKLKDYSRRKGVVIACILLIALLSISFIFPVGRVFWADALKELSDGQLLTGFLVQAPSNRAAVTQESIDVDSNTSAVADVGDRLEENEDSILPDESDGAIEEEPNSVQMELPTNQTGMGITGDSVAPAQVNRQGGRRQDVVKKEAIRLNISGGGTGKSWTIGFLDDRGDTVQDIILGQRYDMELGIGGSVSKIRFKDIVVEQGMELGYEELSSNKLESSGLGAIEGLGVAKSFAIDPTSLDFSEGVVTLVASGKELYKCKEWDFEGQSCYGSWIKVRSITPGEVYSFTLTPDDPGFIETNSTQWDLGVYNRTRTDGENLTLLNQSKVPCTPSTVIPDVAGYYATVDNGDGTWTTTFQPDSTYGKDNYIYTGAGNDDNHGSCNYILVGANNPASRHSRSLVWFNLSVLPPGADISSSVFSNYMYQLGSGATSVSTYRLTQDWTEGSGSCTANNGDTSGSTWAAYDGTNAWATSGGSYNAVAESQASSVLNAWINHTITSLIKSQYNGTNPNYGFILISDGEATRNTEVYSYSSDYATASLRPKLSVTYQPRCYYAAGNYTSKVFDAGSVVTWDNITWAAYLPSGTNISFWTHTCDDGACVGEEQSWDGPFYLSPQLFANNVSRYFQYKVLLNTSDQKATPSIQWVTLNYTLDSTNPHVALISISPNPANHSLNNVTINWTASDLNFDGAYVNVSYPNGTLLGRYGSNFTLTTDNLGAVGSYNITLFANDTLGNWNVTSALLIVQDVLPPQITPLEPATGSFRNSQTVTFRYDVSDASALANCSLVINGVVESTNYTVTNWAINNITRSGLPEGEMWWSINCTDNSSFKNAGNSSSSSLIIDITNPVVAVSYPPEGSWLNLSQVDFNYTSSDSYLDACLLWGNFSGSWKLNQTDDSPLSGLPANFSRLELPDGNYLWNVYCNDSAGNWGDYSNSTLHIDTVTPKIWFIGPTPENHKNLTLNYFVINVSHTESHPDKIILYLGGASNATRSYSGVFTNLSLTDLEDGLYSYYVWVNDSAGNTNQTEVYWITIDTAPPNIALQSPADQSWVTESDVLFSYNVTDNLLGVANCSLIIDGSINTTNHSISESVPQNFSVWLADTMARSWSINCTDRGGLKNSSEYRTIRVDTTHPVISSSMKNESNLTINSYICLNASVSDTFSGVNKSWAYILDPYSIPMQVELFDNHTNSCDKVIGDGVYSAELLVDKEGIYNWTLTYANDTAGNLNYTVVGLVWNSTTTGRLAVTLFYPVSDMRINESDGLANYSFLQNCSVLCDSTEGDCVDVVLYARYNQSGFSGDITTSTTDLVNLADDYACGNMTPGSSCDYTFTIRSGYSSGGSSFAVWCRASSTNFGTYISDKKVNISINDHPHAIFAYPGYEEWLHGSESLNASASGDDVGISYFSFEIDGNSGFTSPSVLCLGFDSNCTFNTSMQSQCSEESMGCYLRLNVTDTEGLKNSTVLLFGIDNIAPSTILDRPPSWANITENNYLINASATESGSGTDTAVFYYRVNDTASWNEICTNKSGPPFSCSWNLSALVDGRHYQVGAYVNDSEGNIGYASSHTNITIDRSLPNIRLERPTEGNWSRGYILFSYNVSDATSEIRNCSLIIDGTINQTMWGVLQNTSLAFNSSLASGAHSWRIDCQDAVGNSNSSESRGFNVDYTGPISSIVQPTDNELISGANYLLNASVSDSGIGNISQVTFLYRVNSTADWQAACIDADGASPFGCSWSLSGLLDGDAYQVRVFANDTLGNVGGNDSRTNIRVDNYGPIISLLSPADGETDLDGNLYFFYRVTDLGSGISNCSLYFNNTLNKSSFAPIVEGQTYNFTILNVSNGAYYWNISCFDDFTTPRVNTSENRQIIVNVQYVMNISLSKNNSRYMVSGQYGETALFTTNVSDISGMPLDADASLDIIRGNSSLPWWNTSWQRRRPITINETAGVSKNGTVVLNATGLNPYIRSCDEIRVVANSSLSQSVVPSQVLAGDGLTFCTIAFSVDVAASSSNLVKYYVYYNNTGAPALGYVVNISGTTTYDYWDYLSKGHNAYSSADAGANPPSGGPSVPNEVELTSTAYGQINRSDNSRASVSNSGYRSFRFTLKVSEGTTQIQRLNVSWEGYTTRGTPYNLYVWNYTSGSWRNLGSSTTTTGDVNITAAILSGFGDLVNSSGIINFVAVTSSSPNNQPLYTDYIRLNLDWNLTSGYQAAMLNEEVHINRSVGQTGVVDGLWLDYWDVGGQQTGNYSAISVGSKILYESKKAFTYFEIVPDSVAPHIELLYPIDGNWSATRNISFYYIPTDNLGQLVSCKLIINGSTNQTNSSVLPGVLNSFTVPFTEDGAYSWSINCTDASSNENASEIRTFKIDSMIPKIEYSGGTEKNDSFFNRNWIYVNVSIDESNPNTTTFFLYNNALVLITSANVTNGNTWYNFTGLPSTNMPYYYLVAQRDMAGNANSTLLRKITMDSSPPTSTLDKPYNYANLSGEEYNVSALVTDTLSGVSAATFLYRQNNTDSWKQICIDSDGSDGYGCAWTLTGLAEANTYEVRVYANDSAGNIGANSTHYNITIDLSPPLISLVSPGNNTEWNSSGVVVFQYTVVDALSRVANCSLVLNGAKNGSSSYSITEGALNNFTRTLQYNQSYSWRINCTDSNGLENTSGVYFFTLADRLSPTVELVNPPDDDNDPDGNVTFQFRATDNFGIANCSLYTNLSGWGREGTLYDVANYTITNFTKNNIAENLSFIWNVVCFDYFGNSAWGLLNRTISITQPPLIYENYTIPTSLEVLNDAPSVNNVIIEPSQTLLADGFVSLTCNGTVYDQNGFGDIAGANSTIYALAEAAIDGPDNYTNHYTNSSCSELSAGEFTKVYVCGFKVRYYASNGSWSCNITGRDSGLQHGTGGASTTIEPLYAIDVTSVIDYGELDIGLASASDEVVTIRNVGNMMTDLAIRGYGSSLNDGLSMNCTSFGNISVEYQKFSLSADQAFGDMTYTLTPGFIDIADFDLAKQTDDSINSTREVYWKLMAPIGSGGTCRGTVIFSALS